ncbi:MAG: hypothetical protein R2932_15920 [Caldilineaceae bacterium]
MLLVGGGADLLTLQAMAQTLGIAERCCFVGRVPPAGTLLFSCGRPQC